MKELLVVSGKGGTGKTSLAASFAALAEKKVLADCDVEAADLHLVLQPTVKGREAFWAGRQARIRTEDCTACGVCAEVCRFDAVRRQAKATGTVFVIDALSCEGCGVCAHFCPEQAIDLADKLSGEWFISETRYGPLVHARLGIAESNSGKLVTLVRKQAQKIAAEKGLELILIDGSPGIGCPVIASMTGCSLVVAVTEPTPSGLHDLERVLGLAGQFGLPALAVINKADLNRELTKQIEMFCQEAGVPLAGKIPYDPRVIQAQLAGVPLVEYKGGNAAAAVRKIWREVKSCLLAGARDDKEKTVFLPAV